MRKLAIDRNASEAEFIAYVQAGGVVERHHTMPDQYRNSVIRFVEMHANSEYMGALLERDWIARAPTLARKIAVAAKVQDEVGHAQLLYCVLEDLGRPRAQVLRDLAAGRTKFHSFFHYPTESWADVAIIAWLSDAASMIAQTALLESSYGPYRRALRKICWEEALHIRHGRDILDVLVRGTAEQFALAQRALDTWWPRLLFFHGPRTTPEADMDLTVWKLKGRANEDMRQEFLSLYVPKILALGLVIPDPELRYDVTTDRWHYTEPDWEQMRHVARGHGPASAERIGVRSRAFEESLWVTESLQAEAEGPS